ncbi:hypothetical protein ACLB2K_069458 [Fragaria x ananassa]
MNDEFISEIKEEEVYKALKQMHPMKESGPDGFLPIFYQCYWQVVGKDVTSAVRHFMNSDALMRQVNGTYITLIPKVQTMEHITQLRPISLCNAIYKLWSKVLANRLKPLLQKVIAPTQSAFVPRRQISDNSLLAFEISHYLKRLYGGGSGYGALKLDMVKAYDRVEWGFIEEVMRSMGFHGWKDKHLSAAGKEIIIKAVVQSIPTYVMSVFELPKHICHEMQRCMAEFWWGDWEQRRKIHWVAWDKLCVPKEEDGLGFRNMEAFNQALLAKQAWRILQQPESLVALTLRATYFPGDHFLRVEVENGDSYAWRSILKGRDLLRKGIRFQVGSGQNISVWHDHWLPRPCTFKPYSGMMEGLEDLKVADLIDPDSREWMMDWLKELFMKDDVEMIRRIPLSFRLPEDKLVWHFDTHGSYSVKSGYRIALRDNVQQDMASSSSSQETSKVWKKLWCLKI